MAYIVATYQSSFPIDSVKRVRQAMPEEDLTSRRKRLIYRANHCGMKENDHLIGLFATAKVGDLAAPQLDQFEALLKLPDNDLYNWITGREQAPYGVDCEVLDMIIQFNKAN